MTSKTDSIVAKIDEKLGSFVLRSYEERAYKKLYYAIRELQGLVLMNQEGFDWNAYKTKFEEVFGTIDEPKFSLEELLEYSKAKFNMNLDEMVAFNRKSLNKRKEMERKRDMEYQAMRRQMAKVPRGYEPEVVYYDEEFQSPY